MGASPDVSTCLPINTATGNKFYKEVDFRQSNVNPLEFIRYYNSQTGGEVWRHSYQQRLTVDASAITLVRADGKQIEFALDNGNWVGPGHRFESLSEDGTDYLVNYPDRRIERYNSTGLLQEITFPSGMVHTISYSGDDLTVTRVGESLTLTRDIDLRVTAVTTPEGDVYQYVWSSGSGITRLQEVIYPDDTAGDMDNPRRLYQYSNQFANNIIHISDGQGHIFSEVSYDDSGRAITSDKGNGVARTTVEYLADGSRRLTNALGKQTTIRYTQINGEYLPIQREGHASVNCVAADKYYTYTTEGLLASKADWKGVVTSYTYDDRGLEISRTEAQGTPEAQVITTQWHPTFRLPTVITESLRKTTMSYDVSGRLLTRTVETVN